MPLWSQHLLVLIAVVGCASFIAYQGIQSFRGKRKNSCGTCKTCGPAPTTPDQSPPPSRTQFIPADALRRKR